MVYLTPPDSRWEPNKKRLSPVMANHFSALKRARQTERRTARNRSNTSRLRSALRDMREALAKGDKAVAEQTFRNTASALDKAIQKGVIHENTAARYKSRLNARLVALK
jgi:small subunit ribosomal protein S20